MPEPDLATALALVIMRLDRELAARKAGALTVSELGVLGDLAAGPATPGKLAGLERMRAASMTRHVTMLEKRGLIRREPSTADRRAVTLTLTGAGRAAFQAACRDGWLAVRLRELPVAEREVLRAALPVLAWLLTESPEVQGGPDETAGEHASQEGS